MFHFQFLRLTVLNDPFPLSNPSLCSKSPSTTATIHNKTAGPSPPPKIAPPTPFYPLSGLIPLQQRTRDPIHWKPFKKCLIANNNNIISYYYCSAIIVVLLLFRIQFASASALLLSFVWIVTIVVVLLHEHNNKAS